VNLSSAVFGAAATWALYRAALHLVSHRAAACAGALALGASRVFWSQSVVAEVYTLNAALTLALLVFALRWREAGRRRDLLAFAGTLGLGLANHPLAILAGGVLALFMLASHPRAVLAPRALAGSLLLLVAGLSLYLYLPIRSAADPPLNVGNPRTLAGVISHVTRAPYQEETEQDRYLGEASDVALHAAHAWVDTGRALTWPLAALAAVGAVILARRRPDVFVVTVALALMNTVATNLLLFAQWTETWAFVHRVYYLPTHAVAALWIAVALDALLARAEVRGPAWRAATLAGAAALLAGAAAAGFPHADRSGDTRARDFALDLLDSAPPGAGFLPLGDEVVYPLIYLKWVEGLRPDVHVMRDAFGWHGEEVRALLLADPLSEALSRHEPQLTDFQAVPHGLAYRLVRGNFDRPGYDSFVPLPSPRDAGLEDWPAGDLFAAGVRARYAAYYARLGARALSLGRPAEARRAFARAETLDPGDAFVAVLLHDIHEHFGLLPERRRALLESALERYDRHIDPFVHRFYPITREDILVRLAEAEAREG